MMIFFAAAMWGMIGFFVVGLTRSGFSAMEIVAVRVFMAAIILFVIGAIFYRQYLKIDLSDFHLFIGTGIFSIVFFNWCYFSAINLLTIPIAVSLLYTAPAFVAILSFLFLKEKMTRGKLVVVALTVIGCALAAGFNIQSGSAFSAVSLLIGLGAGFGYALYSIFGKVALRKYHPFTVTLYTFIVASVALVPTTGIFSKHQLVTDIRILLLSVGLAVFPTVLAYFAYSWGLERTDSSTAAVVSTLEPVVATLLGVLAYGARLETTQLIGSVLIVVSVLAVNVKIPIRKQKKHLPL